MRSRYVLLSMMLLAVACDGDGCHGGPDGPATRFCQQTFARLKAMDAGPGSGPSCEQCCVQEVHYQGRIEDGLCVCR
jgi:hypothetical protein